MKQLLNLLLVIFIFSSCSSSLNKEKHKCGEEIEGAEMFPFIGLNAVQYTKDDSVNLKNIKKVIFESLKDSSKIKVEYNLKTSDSLAVEIYGIEDLNKIDSVACLLFNNKSLNLPTNLIILFNEAKPQNVDKVIISAIKR
ncbi:MAG TPA: hypothetical protein VIJ92_13775 [Ginsengibacter sp.]